jgi:uncharacterized membrane protein YkvA (DUF1232 family)
MKNPFFLIALKKATRFAGKPGRLLNLGAQLASKLRTVDWKSVSTAAAKEKINILARLIRAYATGEYREVPWKAVLVVVAAILYFLNPIDLIPDLLPIVGLSDDFAVLVWVYNSVGSEINKFLTWEQSKIVS